MLTLVMIVGVTVVMNLSEVGSALADEVACMACKAQAQGFCYGSGTDSRTSDWQLRCLSRYIAENCTDACEQKSRKSEDD